MLKRFVLLLWLASAVTVACSAPSSSGATPAAAPATALDSGLFAGEAPPGSLVTLEPAAGPAPPPEGGALMDQFAKAFVPETLFVRVGQSVTFKNSDDQLHNVTVVRSRTGSTVMNISQSEGDVHVHEFAQPGEYAVTCDVHPGMRATIVAATTPHATYADSQGRYTFQKVTPGQYRLKIAVDGRDAERMVEVK
jgi:plastocyanin